MMKNKQLPNKDLNN